MPHLPVKLGPFEPLCRLGAGGMAETFVAVRRGPAGFEQRVCLKRILPAYANDPEFVRAFLAEARTSATLRHANIVQVVDFGRSGPTYYLALELVDGLDLRALLSRGAELDAELTLLVAAELAAALEHAHAVDEARPRVFHRDISPSNVLVSRAGEVKLTDFGIARMTSGTHHTASGVIKGKAPYMPPEYIEGGQFDERGDLFALGVLLFELLHGERPFDGASELDTLRRIVAGERRPFTADAPEGLAACIDRLLARDPADRFPSARALLDALPPLAVAQARRRLGALVRARAPAPVARDALAAPPTLISPYEDTIVDVTHTERRRGPRRMPSQPALIALAGALTLAGLVAAVGLFRRDSYAADTRPRIPEVVAPAREPAGALPATVSLPPAPPPMPQNPSPPVEPPPIEPPPVARAAELPAGKDASAPSLPSSAAPPERAPAQAELRIVVFPFGDVWVDEKRVGASPLSIRVSPGSHTVAVGEGRPRERRTIQVAPGEHLRLLFEAPGRKARSAGLDAR